VCFIKKAQQNNVLLRFFIYIAYLCSMKELLTNILKFVLFTAIGLGILYYVYSTQNATYQQTCGTPNCSLIDKIVTDFKSVNLFWVGVTLLMFTISNISRAYRWEMLILPLGYRPRTRNTYLAIMAAYLANLAVSRIGEVVRCTVVAKYEKIPADRLFGTVVIDRLLDVICLLIAIGLTFLLQFNTIWSFIQDNADFASKLGILQSVWFWAVCLLGAIGLGVLYLQRDRISHLPIYLKVRDTILGFWEGILSIGKLEKWWLFLLHTFIIWVSYYLMTYFCFKCFAPTEHLGAVAALTVFVFGSLGIVIPSPGGMGSFQFLSTAALVLYNIDGGDAFSFANIQFAAINMCIIFFGLMAIIALPLLNKNTPNSAVN
jgi:glycosyltransferase 2 family protein